MRPPFRFLPALVAALGTTALGGCDAAIAGYFLPGLGRPMVGRVVDATTHLPVGGATVLAGLGATITDGNGRFSLLGNFAAREISVARAGYVAITRGGVSPDPGGELQFELEPIFSTSSSLPTRFLTLVGPVTGLVGGAHGLVSLGGTQAVVSNNAYALEFKGAVPGKVLSSVLAWGITNDAYFEGAAASQPFHFLNFRYEVGSWALGETVPESQQLKPLEVLPQSQVPIKEVRVAYGNIAGADAVQTDVLLDFGVLGYVPVARALASAQSLKVPTLAGLKYVVTGEARFPGGKTSSLVTLTTNDPGKATFQMLGVPKVSSPPATSAGQRPTFAWSAVPGEVNYEVTVYEVGERSPKWVGYTDQPEITYPGFAPNDINGGALRPDKKYVWDLRAIDLLEETETPSAARAFQVLSVGVAGPVPIKPYRVRKRESSVIGNGFAL